MISVDPQANIVASRNMNIPRRQSLFLDQVFDLRETQGSFSVTARTRLTGTFEGAAQCIAAWIGQSVAPSVKSHPEIDLRGVEIIIPHMAVAPQVEPVHCYVTISLAHSCREDAIVIVLTKLTFPFPQKSGP
jgi:hypothetical protein